MTMARQKMARVSFIGIITFLVGAVLDRNRVASERVIFRHALTSSKIADGSIYTSFGRG
jgi:hypothetical protein